MILMTYPERRLARYDRLRKAHRAWVVPVYVLCVTILFVGMIAGIWDDGLAHSIFLMMVGWTGGYTSMAIVAFVLGLPPVEK